MKHASRWIAAAATLLPAAVVLAQTPPPAEPGSPPRSEQREQSQGASFESLDADGDGRISRTEAAAHSGVSEQFAAYDLNKDGYIEREEVNRANSPAPTTPPQQ
jgi:Ca2+-binding EF-hand superfamily protein